MGKENDLLEAARTGNVVTIGKLLANSRRTVLSAALSSFRRALGPNCQDTSGYTPLHHAVLNGHRDAIQMLLKFDASPTVPDNKGSNPLHLAAWTGNVEIVRTLLTVGVSKDQVNEQNNFWDTPLHFAAQYGHTEVVSILLEHGADPTLCNRKEEGPLDLAAQYGRLDTVELLVKLRPDLFAKIPDSRALLHLAAKNGHHRIVRLLLDAGCDINKTTKSGTALHEAAVFGKIDVVRVLLERRPPINIEILDGHSETALQKIESHSSKVSQEVAKMITAHIRGEPLPSAMDTSPSLTFSEDDSRGSQENVMPGYTPNSETGPNSGPGPASSLNDSGLLQGFEVIEHQNIYDNVPDNRSYTHGYNPHHSEVCATNSTPPDNGAHMQPKQLLRLKDDDADLYMNVNQIQVPMRNAPPKKPQRNSIGILLDQVYNGNSPGTPRKVDQPVLSTPMHLDVRAPQYGPGQSSTLSSQVSVDSDCPPPLPDRNYYDMDQAGEYTQLRRDALPPKHPRDRDLNLTSPEYDPMHEGLSNTSTDSDNTHGSLYETLSNAQSGIPTPDTPFPPYEIGSKPHHHQAQIQLHIHEADDDASLTDVNTTYEGEYHLDHDDDIEEDENDLDAYELLSEAMTGAKSSKPRPRPKPRITPTSSSSSVPSTDSASPSHKPKPMPRRNKPVPAKRSPGSVSSQPTTPSEELTSSTVSESWGGGADHPSTPDQPPPSPNTAMMGIQAKLSASEVRYSDYDNPEDGPLCSCSHDNIELRDSVFFPSDGARSVAHSRDRSSQKSVSRGHLRKLELDLANRSRKFKEFEDAADQLQTRLEKWQARVEETHLNHVNGQDEEYNHGDVYENVQRTGNARLSYEAHTRSCYEHPKVLNGSHHAKVLSRQNSSPVATRRTISPPKPKRSINPQLSLKVSPPASYDIPPQCYANTNNSGQFHPQVETDDLCSSPSGYDNPSVVIGSRFSYESYENLPTDTRSHAKPNERESPIVPEVKEDEHLSLDNKLVEGNSETDILKPDASHPFAGLIFGSNRGSRSFSLSHQDRLSSLGLLHPGLDRAGGYPGRMSAMTATMVDGQGKGDEQGVGSMDESSEWDQIESIMNSFGAGLVRESVYVRDYQRDFEKMFEGPGRPQSVGEWLDSLKLGQYENMLIANGFDHLDFIGGNIIEDQDLMDIGIVEEIHRKMIVEATRCLPIMKPIGAGPEFSPKPACVSDWLRSLLLTNYISNFQENKITSMDRALNLWECELENVLEIPMLGHRKRILASLGERRRSRHSSTVDFEITRPQSLDIDLEGDHDLELQIESFVGPEEREEIRRHTSQSSSLDIDLYKDYSKEVTSPMRSSASPRLPVDGSVPLSEEEEFRTLIETTEQYARMNGDAQRLDRTINDDRGVNENGVGENEGSERMQNGKDAGSEKAGGVPLTRKQSDTPAGPQWMHPPDALIKGCCNYTSSYLGSSIIKELHGTESTREACTRLRRSAQHLQKMPAITLSINYGGVKFIDSKSKMVITEHEICNISCVAQDSDDLTTFAYITKDIQYEKLYCHVFTVKTVELATEIILTLGQAFEIAYKMLLKTRGAELAHHHANGHKAIQGGTDETDYQDTRL